MCRIVAAFVAAFFAAPALADIAIDEAIQVARDNGMAEIHSVDLDRSDGEWEMEGLDANGREIEIDIDLETGEVVKIETD